MRVALKAVLWLLLVAAAVLFFIMTIGVIALLPTGDLTAGGAVVVVIFALIPLVLVMGACVLGIRRLSRAGGVSPAEVPAPTEASAPVPVASALPASSVQNTPVSEPVATPIAMPSAPVEAAADALDAVLSEEAPNVEADPAQAATETPEGPMVESHETLATSAASQLSVPVSGGQPNELQEVQRDRVPASGRPKAKSGLRAAYGMEMPGLVRAARERMKENRERRDREGYKVGDEWIPPKPIGTLMDSWVQGRSLEVVGEAFRPEAFQRLMGRKPGFYGDGVELTGEAILVPDPKNPYGKGEAVAVYFAGEHVGYLAQADAHMYFPALSAMRASDLLVRVHARAWARAGSEDRAIARVTLRLPEPRGLVPANDLPEGECVVLPAGRKIQVTKEEEHMDVLGRYVLRGSSVDNYVAATLRTINEIRPRSSYEAVQVEIDGERIGVLTKVQSEKLLPLIKHVEQRGLTPVVRATVKGSSIKADVVLDTADASMVEDDWLDSLGAAVTEANVDKMPEPPQRPDFEWDDE